MLMTFARLGSKVVALLCSRRFCNYQVHPLIVIFHTLIILYGVGTLKKICLCYSFRFSSDGKVQKNSGFGCEMVFKRTSALTSLKKKIPNMKQKKLVQFAHFSTDFGYLIRQ